MASSAIPHAVAGLHDHLTRLTWPERDPQVTLGWPKELDREVVMLGPAAGDQEWSHVGARTREERFTVALYVMVGWPGHTALDAMERAWSLFAVIEESLRDPDHIAVARNAGVLWSEIKNPQGAPTIEDDGYGYVLESAIGFTARI
jgi:hypothetical protein